MINLTHSIPEPNGVLITTPEGNIFHTGDWKLDPDPLVGEKTDEEALKKIGDQGVLAMVCDSTNVFQQGPSGSEKDVFDNLREEIAKHADACIAVTCFASNVARLQSIAKAAKACGRQVVMAGRSFKRMEDVSRRNGYLKDVPPFISIEEAEKLPRTETLYLCTGSQGEGRSVLKRIAEGTYNGVTLEAGDVVIFSSRMIPGNEKKIGALKNLLLRQGLHVITQRQADIHVSGHPGREDLEQMYAWVRPKVAIPVHGELRHLLEHGKLARQCGVEEVIIVDNGSLVRLDPAPAEIVEEVPVGLLALDGDAVIRMDHSAIKERGKLSYNGVVFVSLSMDAEGDITSPIHLDMKGLVNVDNVLNTVQNAIEKVITHMDEDDRDSVDKVKEQVSRAVRKTFMQHMKKKPVVMVQVVKL